MLIMCVTYTVLLLYYVFNDDCTVGLLAIRTLLYSHISLLFAIIVKHNCYNCHFSYLLFFV